MSNPRPPIWMMRQAGRALPEYRELRERHSFLELVQTPELATEATLQPIRRFGFDAAVLFCDILVVNEALGQSYRFRDGGGIQMDWIPKTSDDIRRLKVSGAAERLEYVARALKMIKEQLKDETALLGFAGAPWTLAAFMMEGGSAREFVAVKHLFYEDRELFDLLMEKLTQTVIDYLKMQIDAGADAVQLFDSAGGILAGPAYEEASGRWIRRIIQAVGDSAPVILFARGVNNQWDQLAATGARALSVDWKVDIREVRMRLPAGVGIQGNLDPFLLESTPAAAAAETGRILEDMRGLNGFIFNLGHGVKPASKIENIEKVVQTVKEFE